MYAELSLGAYQSATMIFKSFNDTLVPEEPGPVVLHDCCFETEMHCRDLAAAIVRLPIIMSQAS